MQTTLEVPINTNPKCVIFCGGKGTRMGNATSSIPKPMLEVGEKPILSHIMLYYRHYFPSMDFYLPTGYLHQYIDDYYYYHQNVYTRFTGIETKTSRRLFMIRDELENDKFFHVTYGDGLSDIDLNALQKFHLDHGKIATITGIYPQSKFGMIVADKSGKVSEMVEKPRLEILCNGGFIIFNTKIFEYIDGKDEMLEETIFPKLARDGELMMYSHQGFWECMDTQREWERLNELWITNNAKWRKW